MSETRKTFPTIFIPIDAWGEQVIENVRQSTRLFERELLHQKWIGFSRTISADSSLDDWLPILQELQNSLTKDGQDSYEQAFPQNPLAQIIVVGSLSTAGAESTAQTLLAIREQLRKVDYRNQLVLQVVLEIAHFIGEGTQSYDQCFPPFASQMEKAGWNHRIYLLSNYTQNNNLIAANRQQVRDAGVIFLEALILGENWQQDGGGHVLLPEKTGINIRGGDGEPAIFSGFGALLLCSALPYLQDYLIQVSAGEVLQLAAQPETTGAEERLVLDPPELARRSATFDERPVFPRFRLRLFGARNPQDGEFSLPFFSPKRKILKAIQAKLEEFSNNYQRWWKASRRKLPETALELAQGLPGELVAFEKQRDQQVLEQAKQKRFLAGLKKLADALVAPMRIDLADIPGDWMEMPEHDLGDILQHPDFDLAKENTSHKQESNATDPVLLDILGIWRRIRKAVTLLPNATALFIFAGIFVALELVVTRMLVNQIWGPERGLMFLLIGLGVWILVWGFLAWRVPAAAVEKEVRRMEKLLNDVATESETEFSTNADKLRDHWLRVGYRLAEWLQRRRGQRLNNNLQFLDAVRGGYEKDYPLAPYNPTLLHVMQTSRFIRLLDAPQDWQQALRELHLEPQGRLGSLASEATMPPLWLDQRPQLLVDLILGIIKADYEGQNQVVPGSNPRQVMDGLISEWTNILDPLVPLNPLEIQRPAVLFCAHAPCWQDDVDETFADRLQGAIRIGLRTESRIYFYRVFPDFPKSTLWRQGEKE
ncbi:MAG TPA: hypothetical protein PLS77_04645 [Anaerolineaceae bacterium]|nr:hypothetical protein [Anaerolineaceae bacterium]HQH34980.1 hypothetical protein [Anaerolineaceae bacterium]HQJ03035.1 hypothetical protein [Anaerolineaceae bacterium]